MCVECPNDGGGRYLAIFARPEAEAAPMGAGGLPADRRLPVSYQDVAPDEPPQMAEDDLCRAAAEDAARAAAS